MFPKYFDYFAPKTLTEALALLDRLGFKAKVLAGGQSLLPALKSRNSPLISSLESVIDISGIDELNYICEENELLKIGALTTISTLENDLEIASSLPILKDAASEIADPLVRNLGTVGGNLCYADPVNDLPATMLALNASITLASTNGNREINIEEFYSGPYRTTIKPNEVLTEIKISLEASRRGNAYCKIRKGSGGFTIAGVAANLSIEADNTVSVCRIALTGVGPKALRARSAEQALIGMVPEGSVLGNIANLAIDTSRPVSDTYASDNYRRKVLGLLVKDALETSYKRAVMGNYE